jgi:nucleoside diphosphate kinase
MSNLGVQLVKTEEQLEYATEGKKAYCSRVRALEQALILQENELDNALALIRQNAKQGHDFLETGKTTNHFASEDVDERFPIRKMLIASEKVKEQFLIRKQLKAVRGELEQAQQERDMAVAKATAASIQLTESQALVEQMRALMWQQDPATNSKGVIKRDFLWSKDDDNLGISFYDDDCTDATEDNTSVSSEDLHGSGKDMDYNPRRRREEAYWNQPL